MKRFLPAIAAVAALGTFAAVQAQTTGFTEYDATGTATVTRVVDRPGTGCMDRTVDGTVVGVLVPDGRTFDDCSTTSTSTTTTTEPATTTSTTSTTTTTTSTTTTTTTTIPAPVCVPWKPILKPTATAAAQVTKSLLNPANDAPLDMTDRAFKFRVKASSWTDVQIQALVFTDIPGNDLFGSAFSWSISAAANDWVDVTLTPSDFSTWGGTPNWATARTLTLYASGPTGTTISFDTMTTVPQNAADAAVSVVFDDGWWGSYNVGLPIMRTAGMRGTAYIIPDSIYPNNDPNFINEPQVVEFANAGWDIAGHGYADLSTLTTAQRDTDLRTTFNWLKARNYKGRTLYAYPNGTNNTAIRAAVAKAGFTTGRTINRTSETVGAASQWQEASFQVYSGRTAGSVNARIDAAIANGDWLILGFHDLSPDGTTIDSSIDWPQAEFQAVIDHLKATGVRVAPVSEVLTGRTVSTPTPICQ